MLRITNLKYTSLRYDHKSMNLGDIVQSLAVEQFLPPIDFYVDRESMNQVNGDENYLVVLNGWFAAKPERWPPSDSIKPVFFGFHINPKKRTLKFLLNKKAIDYFKKHEPIGCRDKPTAKLLSDRGVKVFYSKCLTMTFPKREKEPKNGKVFLVDIDPYEIPIQEDLLRDSVEITHLIPHFYPDKLKRVLIKHLLNRYRTEAGLVITGRLHCALPCIAFGIPVIFFGNPGEGRVSLLKEMGVTINKKPGRIRRKLFWLSKKGMEKNIREDSFLKPVSIIVYKIIFKLFFNKKINWNPSPVDIDEEKKKIMDRFKELLNKKIKAFQV